MLYCIMYNNICRHFKNKTNKLLVLKKAKHLKNIFSLSFVRFFEELQVTNNNVSSAFQAKFLIKGR